MQAFAGETQDDPASADYSLEDLLTVEVVTASRKSQDLLEVPAAAYVLTHDDIARSGATNLPDALRTVPGVQVARLSSGTWAVSVRGFNDRFSNKLQVLIDGRSIYSPLFAGVLWEGEPVPLADIERIEIIRGPGAAAWGANAVNGVINIITHKASATQGGLATASVGTQALRNGYARYGFSPAQDWYARLWASAGNDRASTSNAAPTIVDGEQLGSAGLRIEQALPGISRTVGFTGFHSEIDYGLDAPQTTAPYLTVRQAHQEIRGASLSYREERTLSAMSDLVIQLGAERTDLDIIEIEEMRTKLEADVQHRVRWAANHELVWGGALSYSDDRLTGAYPIDFAGTTASQSVWSVFAQDELRLSAVPVTVSYGMRVDRSTLNERTSWQPNLRALWAIAPGHAVWAAVARAERLPSRAEYSANITVAVIPPNPMSPLPVATSFVAGSAANAGNEQLDMAELGYRGEWFGNVFFDAAAFAGRYRDLRSFQPLTPYLVLSPPHYVQPAIVDWHGRATVSGLELALDWKISPTLRSRITASHLEIRADEATLVADERAALEGASPRNQIAAQWVWHVLPAHELDLTLMHVDALPAFAIDAYTRVDARWAWLAARNLEFSIVGQNIGNRQHAEFYQTYLSSPQTQVRNIWYAKLALKF